MTGSQIRALCREGSFTGPTAGVASGYTQANLVVLPSEAAEDFEQFCRFNPKPCPLLEVTVPGSFEPTQLAPGADVRTDLPRYRVFRRGRPVERAISVEDYWRNDLVAFLIGCSFTFEKALLSAGVPVRHIEQGLNVPMYRTNQDCHPAGRFQGPLVVSMRPMTPEHAELATRVTADLQQMHGGPVQVGDPSALGISDLATPDFGDTVQIRPGEIPVFWACGVTPMEAIARADLELAITHEPGHMFITDILDEAARHDAR